MSVGSTMTVQEDEDEDNEASEEISVIEDPSTLPQATNYVCDPPEVFGTVGSRRLNHVSRIYLSVY